MTSKKTTKKKSATPQKKKTDGTINTLQKELDEKQKKILRLLADYQNLQKRMEKELLHKEKEIRNKYLSELLTLHELLQIAFDDANPKEGLRILLQNIEQFLEKEHIQPIECIGKPFDHNCHHAVTTIEKQDCTDNEIVEEIKKGYFIGDELLRPAQVIVAKKTTSSKEVEKKHE